MKKSSVAILQHDTDVAQSLAGILRSHFHFVRMSGSQQELREAVVTDRPAAHRLPDEEMWTAALDAGASDVCPTYDMKTVLSSVLRNLAGARDTAA